MLRHREAASLDGLPVQCLGEAGALDGADQVLAQAQVVELEVDLEEVVDDVERAPLLRLLELCTVRHLVRPRVRVSVSGRRRDRSTVAERG
eukprot:scaffold35368_cov51-Phaeocystis_antarctica.AAC.2